MRDKVILARLGVVAATLLFLVSTALYSRSFITKTILQEGYDDSEVIRKRDHSLSSLPPDSHHVLEYIRTKVLIPPSNEPYHLYNPMGLNPSDGQTKIIDDLLGGKRDGFYVESGGYTGEVLSNTLFFELERGWHGVLIEPDEGNFAKLLRKNRKAYMAKSCLAETNVTQNAAFLNSNDVGHIVNDDNALTSILGLTDEKILSAHCFPLYSFLLALNTTTVDYFSLDVEGTEYKVLQSIPWDKVNIKTLSVEWNIIPEGREALVKLMTSSGYIHYMEFNRPFTHDFIFVKKGFLKNEANLTLPILDEKDSPMRRKNSEFYV